MSQDATNILVESLVFGQRSLLHELCKLYVSDKHSACASRMSLSLNRRCKVSDKSSKDHSIRILLTILSHDFSSIAVGHAINQMHANDFAIRVTRHPWLE